MEVVIGLIFFVVLMFGNLFCSTPSYKVSRLSFCHRTFNLIDIG